MPPDLADAGDPTRLRAGLAWNSSEVIDRYAAVLVVVAPLVAFYGGIYLGVGNEVNVNLGQHPETAGAFNDFVFTMREYVRALVAPAALPVGVTLVAGELAQAAGAPPDWLQVLFQCCDVTPLTYYPLLPDASVNANWSSAEATLDAAISLLPGQGAPGGPCVVFQEMGCPSGYCNASSTDGSSESVQASFYASFLSWFAARNASGAFQARALSVYQMLDVDAASCETLARYYNTTNPAFIEYLCTLGMVNGADGAPKLAWTAFLDALPPSPLPGGLMGL